MVAPSFIQSVLGTVGRTRCRPEKTAVYHIRRAFSKMDFRPGAQADPRRRFLTSEKSTLILLY